MCIELLALDAKNVGTRVDMSEQTKIRQYI
jgi:hypothetical protein